MISNLVVKQTYTGNGTARNWPIPFSYTDTSQIKVKLTVNGAETLVPSTDYTVDTVAQNIIYPKTADPIPATTKITLYRETAKTQATDLTNQGALYPETLEASFDKLTEIVQEQGEQISRAVKTQISSSISPDELMSELNTTVSAAISSAAEAANNQKAASSSAAAATASQIAAAVSATNAENAAAVSATNAENAAATTATAVGTHNSDTGAHADIREALKKAGDASGANAPQCYKVDAHFYASTQTGLKSPSKMWVNINDSGCVLSSQKDLAVTDRAAWDTKATAWAASTTYKVDDVVYIATNPGYLYRCTTAGTSSSLTPSFPTTIGGTYNDGNAVWICQLDFTYSPTTTVRAASTAYTVGAMIRLSTTDGFVYKCTTAGTTAATAPTFPAVAGSTVTDGTAVWTCILGSNRAGKNFYIYACLPATGIVPEIVLSDNSTIPLKYTAGNSRKIGGFHCLCADAGTITGHTLSGYVAGDVLPTSVWDLSHRPKSEPEGMAYIDGLDIWVDIYLSSYTGAYSNTPEDLKLQSVYGANTADGASTEKFHWYKFSQVFSRQKKRMLHHSEFIAASIGSNQSTNIYGSTDVNIAGGHRDTAGRRMISNFGLEDCCGFLWQWGQDDGGAYTAASYANAYDANDKYVGGQSYEDSCRVLLGGSWPSVAYCGSRCSLWGYGPLYLSADFGSRGASEPLRGGI